MWSSAVFRAFVIKKKIIFVDVQSTLSSLNCFVNVHAVNSKWTQEERSDLFIKKKDFNSDES